MINGVLVENAQDHTVGIAFLTLAGVLLEEDVMLASEVRDPICQLYFAIQMILLDPERASAHRARALQLGEEWLGDRNDADSEQDALVRSAMQLVEQGKDPSALSKLRQITRQAGPGRGARNK